MNNEYDSVFHAYRKNNIFAFWWCHMFICIVNFYKFVTADAKYFLGFLLLLEIKDRFIRRGIKFSDAY